VLGLTGVSHWYRIPRAISVLTLLERTALELVLDPSMTSTALRYLPQITRTLRNADNVEKLSREDVAQICRTEHAILVTVDFEYVPLLGGDSKSSWGVILLPSDETMQTERLHRLFRGKLVFRPAVDRMGIFEYVRLNRLLLDIRLTPPVITVHCDCRWLSLPG